MFFTAYGEIENMTNIEHFDTDYLKQNFVQYTTTDTDIKQINATLDNCKVACTQNPICLGFSRAKNIADPSVSSCWL
jgi:hypothetical protein